nr:uncharacterized protein LOC109154743 [Ipomoea trifida]
MASEPPSPKSHQGKTSVEETNEKDDSWQQKGVGMMIDPMSPYYLHASDAPGQVYVAELLRDGNYGWLKSAMDKDIRGSVRFAITARDIWRDLEERFGKESAPRAFEIRRAVTLLRQDKATVSTYYTKLKSLWDEMNCTAPLPMCNCQGYKCNLSNKYAELREKEQLYDFLMGLDEEFNTVKSQILSTRPIPSLGVAYHMVSEDEQQRLISSMAKHGTEMTAFHVQSLRVEKSRGEPINNKNKRKDRPTCGKFGHKEEQCFEIIGYPANWHKGTCERNNHHGQNMGPKAAHVGSEKGTLVGLTQGQMNKLMQLLNSEVGKSGESSANPTLNMAGKLEHHETWVIDSGATDHIVNNPTLLSKIEEGLTLEEVDWNGTVTGYCQDHHGPVAIAIAERGRKSPNLPPPSVTHQRENRG